MCRFTLYLGPPIRMSTLIIEPEHSLIMQSTSSREREEPLNGDGFGIGWYRPEVSDEPAVFRSVAPAWNNRNLHNLARVVDSQCFLAHVRAATQASGVDEANCHPFRWRRYLCMHNGDVGGFTKVRRRLLETVCDDAFATVSGSTDSEHFFAVVIDELMKQQDVEPGIRTASALNAAIWRVQELVDKHGGGEASYLNIAVSDGEHAAVSRFCSNPRERPESLYYFKGTPFYERTPVGTSRHQDLSHAIVVSSERLTSDAAWREIPANHIVVVNLGEDPKLFACDPSGLKQPTI
jgi:glutamine amidotransferase